MAEMTSFEALFLAALLAGVLAVWVSVRRVIAIWRKLRQRP